MRDDEGRVIGAALQIRKSFLHWDGEEIPLRIEFISTNSCSKGTRYGGGPNWWADYRVGFSTFSDAWRRRNEAKTYRGKGALMSGDTDQYDTQSDFIRSMNTFSKTIRDGTVTALSYSVVRQGQDGLSGGAEQQKHLVISAPPAQATHSGQYGNDGSLYELYLTHRCTRMADAYCTTLELNPIWSVSRIMAPDIFESIDDPRTIRNIPLSDIDDSVLETLSKSTHIHPFDDHIVSGRTIRAMLCSVVEILSKIGRLDDPPVISVASWHSVTAYCQVNRTSYLQSDDLIIPQDLISGKQTWANWTSKITKNFTLIGRLEEPESEFHRAPSIGGYMESENSVGPTPPVNGINKAPHIHNWYAYDVVRSVGHEFEGREMDYDTIEVNEEALDWYEFSEA